MLSVTTTCDLCGTALRRDRYGSLIQYHDCRTPTGEPKPTRPGADWVCRQCGTSATVGAAHVCPTPAQPPPVPNDRPPVWAAVIADMHARDATGRARYGVPLQPHNGRDALRDAYEEALDLAVYLKQALLERGGASE